MLAHDPREARDVLVAPPQVSADQDQEPSREEAQCRFCLEKGGDDLIAPCMCKGHSKWVHRRCLDQWRSKGQGARSFTHCPTCSFGYLMELQRAPTETEQHLRQRRRAILRAAVGQFFLGAILLQLWLCLFAFLIRVCDPTSELVRLLPMGQPIYPHEDTRSYLDTFHYHKATYYFASLVLSAAIVGITVSILACCSLCKGSGASNRGREVYLTRTDPAMAYWSTYWQMRACEDCCECCCHCDRHTCCHPNNCPDAPTVNLPSVGGGSSSGGGGGSNNNGGSVVAVIIIAIVVIFALVGLFFAMAALVTWLQRVSSRYLALKELRALTGEYVVKDLSELKLPTSAPTQAFDVEAGSAPPPEADFAWMPTLPPEVQRSVQQDLQAVYGYNAL